MHRGSAVLLAALALAGPVHADGDPVVVTVGSVSLKASDVARRLARVPEYQRATLGPTRSAAVRKFVDGVLVPELLVEQADEARRLADTPAVRARIQDALRAALDADLLDAVRRDRPVTTQEIEAYHATHRSAYETGQRIEIWRIVVRDEALARRILKEAHGAGGPERWRALAREHSVDEATKLRGGDLGFVAADGTTQVPQVRVDPALYAAVAPLKDGELVTEPVREGERFAAVWRRGSRPADVRTPSEEAARIRLLLERKRVQEARTELLAKLRGEHVKDLSPDLIDELRAPPDGTRPLTAVEPSSSAAVDPAPRKTPNGLR